MEHTVLNNERRSNLLKFDANEEIIMTWGALLIHNADCLVQNYRSNMHLSIGCVCVFLFTALLWIYHFLCFGLYHDIVLTHLFDDGRHNLLAFFFRLFLFQMSLQRFFFLSFFLFRFFCFNIYIFTLVCFSNFVWQLIARYDENNNVLHFMSSAFTKFSKHQQQQQ